VKDRTPAAARILARNGGLCLQIRNRRGRWVAFPGLDPSFVESHALEILAAWARADERKRMVAEGWTPPRKRRKP